ncbi:MAG: hypothetical protein ABL959_15835, partial [Pyrinomonadaceae bacterium]
WDCRHVAGYEYSVNAAGVEVDPTDSAGSEKRMAFVWIENARLSEVSAVYDGATTNAMIIKAEREARAGRLEKDVENYLERRFRFRRDVKTWIKGDKGLYVPDDARHNESESNSGELPENNRSEKTTMTEQEMTAAIDTERKASVLKLRTIGVAAGVTLADDISSDVAVAELERSTKQLVAKAAKYDEVRNAEIDAAIVEKIRAEGETFGVDAQAKTRAMLEAVEDIATIREFKTEWAAKADIRFPKSRVSDDGEETPDGGTEDGDGTETPEATALSDARGAKKPVDPMDFVPRGRLLGAI